MSILFVAVDNGKMLYMLLIFHGCQALSLSLYVDHLLTIAVWCMSSCMLVLYCRLHAAGLYSDPVWWTVC